MRIALALLTALSLAACGGSKKAAKSPANTDTTAEPREAPASEAPGGAESSKSGNGDADDSKNDPGRAEDPCMGGE